LTLRKRKTALSGGSIFGRHAGNAQLVIIIA